MSKKADDMRKEKSCLCIGSTLEYEAVDSCFAITQKYTIQLTSFHLIRQSSLRVSHTAALLQSYISDHPNIALVRPQVQT
jgi:hypothetical protein